MITTAQEYQAALKRHDWSYEYSDDGQAYRKGRDEREALSAAQPILDPDFSIWNSFAPSDYQRKLKAA
jgi:hypothetical protein